MDQITVHLLVMDQGAQSMNFLLNNVQVLINPLNHSLKFFELIEFVAQQYVMIRSSIMYVLNLSTNIYEIVGRFPGVPELSQVYFSKTKALYLKCCLVQDKPVVLTKKNKVRSNTKASVKKVKERHIAHVVSKVTQWRNLFDQQKIPLEKAADMVGICRKTLDDYNL